MQQQKEIILEKYPNAKIEKEQFTGVVSDRPVLNRVVSKVSKGDTLVVSKLDRLARNTKDGIEIIEQLFSKGVAVHVLNVGLLEDTTMGKFFLTTMLAVAEMERNMIIERTQAGKEIARTKDGFKEGRPHKFKQVTLDHALSLLSVNGGEMSYTEVVKATGISKSTLIRENKSGKGKIETAKKEKAIEEMRKKIAYDKANALYSATEEGIQEGIKEGKLEGKLEVAKKILNFFDDLKISEILNLDINMIKNLRK